MNEKHTADLGHFEAMIDLGDARHVLVAARRLWPSGSLRRQSRVVGGDSVSRFVLDSFYTLIVSGVSYTFGQKAAETISLENRAVASPQTKPSRHMSHIDTP